ncbi:MAG: 2-oxoglutarate dehydrogenase complex dihydrolipoyllysine-residue succinyltransferase [Candidatus Protochlamydia sp.]|nr:2-oxoglutarate dehydrogenase complex dihydrolipoyllysine-residue succinyltransferase [Candidatus Protochlamydia sp.]
MKIEIKIPAMGESITQAVIGQILVPNGEIVKADAEIVELETDKVNQILFAPQAGRLSLRIKSGDTVKIGESIGFIETEVEEIDKKASPPTTGQKNQEVEKQPAKSMPETEGPLPPPRMEDPKQSSKKEPEPAGLQGTENSLRITKESFLQNLTPQKTVQAEKPQPGIKPPQASRETRRPLSKIRRIIGARMVEAQQTTAMLTTFNEADLSLLIELREQHQEAFFKKYGTKLGYMSFFAKAVVSALQVYPQVNSYLSGEEVVQRHYYDVGIAVGTDKGTLVPVVRNCDRLSFAQIETAIDEFAKKAREGKMSPDDLQGGSMTITNGGVYGSLLSTPILNPPQCAILGMHKIEKRAVVINDQIVIRPMMYLALSYDHRMIDGKESVAFLVHIKKVLEDPAGLLFDITK